MKDLCLGALTFGDASGYDLKKFFETTFSHFCAAGYGSIYPALAELTAEGLVSCLELPQEGKPDRKLYRLTAAGRKTFLGKLEKTSPQHRVKSDFLLALYFAHLLPPGRLENLLDGRIAELDRQIDLIEQSERDPKTCHNNTPGEQFVCGFGKTVMSAARNYLRSHRHALIAAAHANTKRHAESKHRNGTSRAGIQLY
ncbi:MAG: PadR family transcriptional regulator [Gammaproteobacteria bacterium]